MPLSPATSSRHRAQTARLPVFGLYGEDRPSASRLLHIESITARSSLYGWEIGSHVHPGLHQLIWLQAGALYALLDESRSNTAGPAMVVVPPGVAHAFRFAPHTSGYVLTFDAGLVAEDEDVASGAALGSLFNTPGVLPLAAAHTAVAQLQGLWDALHAQSQAAPGASPDPVPRWLARSVIWRLAELRKHLDASMHPVAQRRHALYTRWQLLVETHYRAHWSIARYASTLGLSAERLNRLVRAEAGKTAQEVVHDRLAREACRWLTHVQAPVSQLAFELGFDDPAYFNRFFKRRMGLTPGAYRSATQSRLGKGGVQWAEGAEHLEGRA